MVAIVAALYVLVANWLTAYGWTWIALWVPFISWPLYFLVGAKPVSRVGKEIIGLIGGVLFGWLTIVAIAPVMTIFGSYALPVIVFCVAFIILILELTNWFELATAYFFAYAAYFAYFFGGVGGYYAAGQPAQAMWPVIVLLMVGLFLGFFTANARKKLLEKAGLYGADQKTVFDKEK